MVSIIRHREKPGRPGWLNKSVGSNGGDGSHGGSAGGSGDGGRCGSMMTIVAFSLHVRVYKAPSIAYLISLCKRKGSSQEMVPKQGHT